MSELNISIPKEELEKVQIISERLGLGLNEAVGVALREFIENYNEYLRIVDDCQEENTRPNLGVFDEAD